MSQLLHFVRNHIFMVLLLLTSIVALGQENQSETNTIERINGFYATINYDADTPDQELELAQQPALTLAHIKNVKTIISRYTNQPEIAIKLTKKGSVVFAELTKNNLGKPIAIVLDNKIVYAPVVQSEIDGGRVVISGNFSMEEINAMVGRLTSK